MNKILIIGAGPAGSTLATYLKRFGIDSIVFSNDKTNLDLAYEIENYYGFDKISGNQLFNNGKQKLIDLGIEVISEEVVAIEYDFVNYKVKTTNNLYESNIIVLASGLAKKSLNIKGLKEFEGKGISYCATCDGFFFRNKKIGIIGSGAYMEEELAVLKNVTKDITIFSNGKNYEGAVNEKIVEVYGDTKLRGLKTENNSYELDALFIAEGSYNSFAMVKHLGINTNEKGEIIVDDNFMTNIPNCFAIGDIIPDIKQITIAASHGLRLAYYLKKENKN